MSNAGYYRYPTINRDTIVFVCEDDLWTVPAAGGIARRLTANPGMVSTPALSPDGALLAYASRDEGHYEIYVMPAEGGPARRLTYLGAQSLVNGFQIDAGDRLSVHMSNEIVWPEAGARTRPVLHHRRDSKAIALDDKAHTDPTEPLARRAMLMALMLGAPMLIAALVVGLIVSVLQAVTQIQEQTLAFVPKFAAVAVVFLIALPWLIQQAVRHATEIFTAIPGMVR